LLKQVKENIRLPGLGLPRAARLPLLARPARRPEPPGSCC